MNVEALASYISIKLPSVWDQHREQIAAGCKPGWIDRFDYADIAAWYGFEDAYTARILKEVEAVHADPMLEQAVYAMYYALYETTPDEFMQVWNWSGNPKEFAEHGTPMLCVLALLAGQPIHAKNIAHFDDEQIVLQKQGVRNTCMGEHDRFGIDGIRFSLMAWGTYFTRTFMVTLGRMQYELGLHDFKQLYPYIGEDAVQVYIHVPRPGSFAPEVLDASIAMAKERLPRYFPGIDADKIVLTATSWLLSPDLDEVLPPESNVRKFKDRFHVTEVYENRTDNFMSFVFDRTDVPKDYNELPENSSLQRGLKNILLSGRELRAGFGYMK